MTLTVLFDLDDTLLNNSTAGFQPAYLKALGKHLAAKINPEKMIHELLKATQKMIDKNSPNGTLEETFDQYFYPAVGFPKEELRPLIDNFYEEIFPDLRIKTSPIPSAIHVVETALQRGYNVGIATNPLFPRTAIFQRLEWAGLSPQKYPFSVISTYDDFHFAKPNPAYFAEVVARSDFPKSLAVMVGNSLEEDIFPSSQIGLPGFLIDGFQTTLPEGMHSLSTTGSMETLLDWLDLVSQTSDKTALVQPVGALAWIKATPAVLDTIVSGASYETINFRPKENEWSLAEIVAHLHQLDRTWILPLVNKTLLEINPISSGLNHETQKELTFTTEEFLSLFKEFTKARSDLLALLAGLTVEQWQRTYIHPVRGENSLISFINFVNRHDRDHIQQIHETLEKFHNKA
jgi:FMN phosphatase YigB (HAD superfamily)